MSITLEVKKLLEKADYTLEVAEELKKKNYHPDAASKVYYAMFYAAQALLISEEIDVKKHSAVESSIGYYFAKTGRLDPKYHKMLINARKIREIADYDIQEEIVEPQSTLTLNQGKKFVDVIKDIIGTSRL